MFTRRSVMAGLLGCMTTIGMGPAVAAAGAPKVDFKLIYQAALLSE